MAMLGVSALLLAGCAPTSPAYPTIHPVAPAIVASNQDQHAGRSLQPTPPGLLPTIVDSRAASTPSAMPAATRRALATPPPVIENVQAMALGGATPVRSVPSMQDGETVRTLADQQPIVIEEAVRGERWVVGDQTWAMAIQDWSNLWYQIDGGYVYSGFVYIPRAGELDSIQHSGGARSISVDLSTQTARAMVGDQTVYSAPVTTGKPGFETPTGTHVIPAWGRKFDETMTSSQAGISDPHEQYDVHNVLYTQYFDDQGDALHLNYWQPVGVFGNSRSSHGCVGLELHDAQFFWLFARPGTRVDIGPVPATRPPTLKPTIAASPAATGSVSTAVPTAIPAGTAIIATPTVSNSQPSPSSVENSGHEALSAATRPVGTPDHNR